MDLDTTNKGHGTRKFPLDAFCRKLERYSLENLMKADPKKAVEHYGISEAHAEGYIRLEKERRGLGGNNGA